ncbi:hypothetical protein WJX73_001372 [Symbiochloris irregularis]|uniref:Protein kinase domain-containing protein n=1 Tax=Symbiochloris irregularis TaxID=706552 RepID=A0AAW1NXL8_9CHLO
MLTFARACDWWSALWGSQARPAGTVWLHKTAEVQQIYLKDVQVWWHEAGDKDPAGGQLTVAHLGTERPQSAIPVSSPVTCIETCGKMYVWTGHADGTLAVRSEVLMERISPDFKAFNSALTAIYIDIHGGIWVGGKDGGIRVLEFKTHHDADGVACLRMAERKRIQPVPASMASAIPVCAALLQCMPQTTIHPGPVSLIRTYNTRVWSSGGTSQGCSLIEWSIFGEFRTEVDITDSGPMTSLVTLPLAGGELMSCSAPTTAAQRADKGNWVLASGHESGTIMIWTSDSQLVISPAVRLRGNASPCRALAYLAPMGMWCAAFSNGDIIMQHVTELSKLQDTSPSEQADVQCKCLKAHKQGLSAAWGASGLLITAGTDGSVLAWTEAALLEACTDMPDMDVMAESEPMADLPTAIAPELEQQVPLLKVDHSHSKETIAAVRAAMERCRGNSHDSASAGSMVSDAQAQDLLSQVVRLLQPEPPPKQSTHRSFEISQPEPPRCSFEFRPVAQPLSGFASEEAAARMGSLQSIDSGSRNDSGHSSGTTGRQPSLPPRRSNTLSFTMERVSLGLSSLFSRGSLRTAPSTDTNHLPSASSTVSRQLAESDSPTRRSMGGSEPWRDLPFAKQASLNWLIAFEQLTDLRATAEGSIGRVYHGKYQETDVAIKALSGFEQLRMAMSTAPAGLNADSRTLQSWLGSTNDPQAHQAASLMQTLEREVGIMATMRHPNVVMFMGMCLEPPCLVSEWCSRGSVYDILAKAGKYSRLAASLTWHRRLSMALDAAKGIYGLHQHVPQILHCDVKSPNLVCDAHWKVKVTDFNLSRMMDGQSTTASPMANNPRWQAPEVISQQVFTTKSDVFSFGVVLWELMTCTLPWGDMSTFQIMVAVSSKGERLDLPTVGDPALRGDGISDAEVVPRLSDLISRCWETNPDARPTLPVVISELRAIIDWCPEPGNPAHRRRSSRVSGRGGDLPSREATSGTENGGRGRGSLSSKSSKVSSSEADDRSPRPFPTTNPSSEATAGNSNDSRGTASGEANPPAQITASPFKVLQNLVQSLGADSNPSDSSTTAETVADAAD